MPLRPLDYILCEGASDARFISLYLCNKFSLKYSSEGTKKFNPITKNSFYIYLEGQERDLLIISCDGCGNIDKFFSEIVMPGFKEHDFPRKILIVIDRDKKTDEECFEVIKECKSYIDVNINGWASGTVLGGYIKPDGSQTKILYNSFFAVIPSDKTGAFESILIEAASTDEPEIHKCVDSFFKSMPEEAKKYIKEPRKESKALLDTILILMDPEKLFCNLESLFSSIDCNNPLILKTYSFLDSIFEPIK